MLKKLSNRRIYDSARSRYVTLEMVQTEILYGNRRVMDTRTKEDCTVEVLLGIMMRDCKAKTGPSVDEVCEFIKDYREAREKPAVGGR